MSGCNDEVMIRARATHDPENPGTVYVETGDGLRLIFRDGKYAGWYTPTLPDALN